MEIELRKWIVENTETFKENGVWCGILTPCPGVFAQGNTRLECLRNILSVYKDWLVFRNTKSVI